MTVSELTREAIQMLLDASPGRRRLTSARAGESGRSDLAERIEDIIANEVTPSR